MNPERWQRVKDLFHSALDLDADARVSFLEDACGDDAALQAEVRSLLDAHQESSIFDKPAFEVASGLLGDETGDPLLGGELGPYRVLSTLGRGGMGVVYLAEDTRLRRPVAIKALPPEFTDDDRFRARLRQEAMTTAALSHPGIATVFALEDIDNHLYLVREYVAGETLRDLLAAGPVPMDVLLDVAVDIGRALEAAHAGGVIHRDLKPENVMRTPQAVVKVLDFGLARFERLSSDTDDGVRLTRLGAAIGTPGYMSPEQLRGDPVDARTDHFSLGVVLYELARPDIPLKGGDSVATMARVLSSAPQPVVSLRPDCPPALATVIDRCLQKAATDRFPSTQVLVGELEAARVPGATTFTVAGRRTSRRCPLRMAVRSGGGNFTSSPSAPSSRSCLFRCGLYVTFLRTRGRTCCFSSRLPSLDGPAPCGCTCCLRRGSTPRSSWFNDTAQRDREPGPTRRSSRSCSWPPASRSLVKRDVWPVCLLSRR